MRTRVEGSVNSFLAKQFWRTDLNKNQLRETLRKHISVAPYLDAGVERIVDQVVNPKIYSVFMPQVEDVVYKYLGLERPKREKNGSCGFKDLLPIDLDPVSPESDKNSLKDVSLDSVDVDISTIHEQEKALMDSEENNINNNAIDVENDKINNGHCEEVEKVIDEEKELGSSTPLLDMNLNDSIKSDDKAEEEEEDSPVFEPIDIMNLHDSNVSNDSHLSGISELTSHRSCSPDFGNEFSRDNFDFSNQDSQFSKVSSNSRLSIVTDFGSSNQASTPVSDLKEEVNKKQLIKDKFQAIHDDNDTVDSKLIVDKSKENIVELKEDTKSSKTDLSSKESSRDGMDSNCKDKTEHKDKSRESAKLKSKERSDSKNNRNHRDRDKDNKRKSSSTDPKNDNNDKLMAKDKCEETRDDKITDSSIKPKEGKDLKDIYKEKIRELREKKELTEKEKLKQDNDSKIKDKKDSRTTSSSSSSKNHNSARHESKSKSSRDDSKSSRSSKDSKRSDSRHSKDKKNISRSESADGNRTSRAEKDEKSDSKSRQKSSGSSSSTSKKESRSDSHSRSSEKSDSKRDSDSKDKRRRDDKKSKSKDDHSSLRKGSNDRRSSDRDGSNGSNGKGTDNSNLSPSTSSSLSKSATLTKESSNTGNSSGEASDGIDEQTEKCQSFDAKITEELISMDNQQIISNDETNPKKIELGTNEISLPLKKRPLNTDDEDKPSEIIIKKPKFARNFQEAKKLMKLRKKLEKQKNRALEKSTHSPLLIVPDNERVQIIEFPVGSDDETDSDGNVVTKKEAILILDSAPQEKSEIIAKEFSGKSKLSEMESSIRESLTRMITDENHELLNETSGQSACDSNLQPEETEIRNKIEDIKLNEKINAIGITSIGIENITQVVNKNNSLFDDEQDCRYFVVDNERLIKFNKFLQSLGIEEFSNHEEMEKINPEKVEESEIKTMAPPKLKHKNSTSPMTDILLNNSNNNNEAQKIVSEISSEEPVIKKKRLGRPKKIRPIPSVGSPSSQTITNGEHFEMPLSPESDVSATSEKTPLHLSKDEKKYVLC